MKLSECVATCAAQLSTVSRSRKGGHLQVAVRGGCGACVLFGGVQPRELSVRLADSLLVPSIHLQQRAISNMANMPSSPVLGRTVRWLISISQWQEGGVRDVPWRTACTNRDLATLDCISSCGPVMSWAGRNDEEQGSAASPSAAGPRAPAASSAPHWLTEWPAACNRLRPHNRRACDVATQTHCRTLPQP